MRRLVHGKDMLNFQQKQKETLPYLKWGFLILWLCLFCFDLWLFVVQMQLNTSRWMLPTGQLLLVAGMILAHLASYFLQKKVWKILCLSVAVAFILSSFWLSFYLVLH